MTFENTEWQTWGLFEAGGGRFQGFHSLGSFLTVLTEGDHCMSMPVVICGTAVGKLCPPSQGKSGSSVQPA